MFAVLSVTDKCNTKSVFCAYHIKPLLSVFILILIGSNCIFSQDVANYNISKFTYDYNYYGFPFYIDAGYMNKKNSRQIFFPLVGPTEYFNNSQKDYAIGNNYLFSLLMFDLSKLKNNSILYNFIAHTHIEYKFFMRFLPLLYNSLYIVFYANAGYGKKYNQNFDKGGLLYTTGGGIGFSTFGVPMQVTVGVDQFNDIVIGFSLSPIIHTY